MNSSYGESPQYEGERGEAYFARQNFGTGLHGCLNTWKFSDLVGPDDDLLDFGCGGGWLLEALPARSRVGVEINPAARRACEARGIEVYDQLASLPAGRAFTRIITHHALEHVPFPIGALREMSARLTHDGLLIGVVPIDDWRMQKGYQGEDPDHHLHTWTPRLMANTCREAGLQCREISILTHAWPRGWRWLHSRLPGTLFDKLCRLWGAARRRRQLRFVAARESAA